VEGGQQKKLPIYRETEKAKLVHVIISASVLRWQLVAPLHETMKICGEFTSKRCCTSVTLTVTFWTTAKILQIYSRSILIMATLYKPAHDTRCDPSFTIITQQTMQLSNQCTTVIWPDKITRSQTSMQPNPDTTTCTLTSILILSWT